MKNISFLIALFCSIQLIGSNLNPENLKFSKYKFKTTKNIVEKVKPNAMTVTVTTDTICSGGSTTMKAKVSGSSGAFKYVWTVPTGMTNPGNVRSFTTSTVGDYYVVVTNLDTNEVGNGAGRIRLSGLPNATTKILNYCGAYDAVNKTRYMDWGPNVTGIADWHYTYSVNGGAPISIKQIGGNTAYNAPSPNSSDIIQMVLYPKGTVCHQKLEWACPSNNPVINTVTDKIGCSGAIFNKIDFTTSANATYYDGVIWTNDNPNIGLAASGNTMYIPSFTAANVTQPITANISVVLTKLGTEVWFDGKGNPIPPITFKITINPLPTATISGSTSICSGKTTTINFTGTPNAIVTYKATGGTNQTITLNASGIATLTTPVLNTNITYDLISVASNTTPACTQNLSGSAVVTVSPGPSVTISDVNICSGQTATVTATTTATGTFVWTVPIGVTNPGNVASFSTSTEGTYSVVLTTSANCIGNASGKVTIGTKPSGTITYKKTCPGVPATLDVKLTTTGTYTYVWTTPVGVPNPGNVKTFSTTVEGDYSVVITDQTSNCKSDLITNNVSFYIKPEMIFTSNTYSLCGTGVATLYFKPNYEMTPNYYYFTFVYPSGFSSATYNFNPYKVYLPGTYKVTLVDQITFCKSDTKSITIIDSQPPKVIIDKQKTCISGVISTSLTAKPDINGLFNYKWTVPTGVTDPGNTNNFTVNSTGKYSVVITDSNGCNSNTASIDVVANEKPQIVLTTPSFCFGSTSQVEVTVTPISNYSYAWNVPVGATNPGNVSKFSTSFAGDYSVVVTETGTGCSNTSNVGTVITNPKPTVALTADKLAICKGSKAKLTATPSVSGTFTYTWTVPSGVTNPGNVASFDTTIAGDYSVTTTNATSNCISDIASITITELALPTVIVSSDMKCANGTNATILASPSSSNVDFVWTVPSGVTNPGNVGTFQSQIAGNYSVIVTDKTTTCTSLPINGTTSIVINSIPTATVNSITVCKGANATITATPIPISGTYSYIWTVPTGETNPGSIKSFTAKTDGNYSVIVTDTVTNCSSTISNGVLTVSNPTVILASDVLCADGTNATLLAAASSTNMNYSWIVPSSVPNPGNVNTFQTSKSGNYSVTVTDKASLCTNTSNTIIINQMPVISLKNATPCSGTSTVLTADSTNSSATYNYAWTVPTGVINPGNVKSFTTTVDGQYSVTATDKATNCVSIPAIGTITITKPTVTITSDVKCATGSKATFLANSSNSNLDYTWIVPTGVTNPGNVNTFQSSIAGIYSVTITDKITSCTSLSSTFILESLPIVTVSSKTICNGDSTTIAATIIPSSSNYSYVWTVPSGVVDPGNVSSFSSSVAGDYSVISTNTSTTCSSKIATGTITTTTPSVTLVTDKNIKCKIDIATLTAIPSIPGKYNYVWTFPSGATSPGNSTTTSTSIAGTYTVKIIDSVLNCSSNTATVTITNHITPSVAVNDVKVCEGQTASLIATPAISGTYDYSWTVPTGVTNPGNVATFDTTIAGTYSVIITDPITTCASISDTAIVTIYPKTIVTAPSSAITICSGITTSIPLTSNNPGTTYSWTVVQNDVTGATDGSGSKISQKLNASAITPGTAIYTILPTFKNCTGDALTITVTVNPNPDVTLTSSALTICSGESINVPLTSSLIGTTFDFSPLQSGVIGASSGAGSNISQTLTTSGTSNGKVVYTIKPQLNNCTGISSKVTVTVNALPNPIMKDGAICVDQDTQKTFKSYTLNSGLNPLNYSFAWTLDGVAITDTTNSITTTKSGTFGIIATNKSTLCKSTEIKALVKATNPAKTISVEQSPAFEDETRVTVIISGGNGIYQYQLDNNDFQDSNFFSGLMTGPHTILVNDADGCTNLTKDFFVVGYPKYFTPNGDGIHDSWNISGMELLPNSKIFIFDRYGKLIKQILSPNDSWDGTLNNERLESTDYWFTIDYFDLSNNKKIFKSHFSLKR